jgi:hypothetical protein
MQSTQLVRAAAVLALVVGGVSLPVATQAQSQVQTQTQTGQRTAPPPRDVAAGEKKGTASIKGRVVTADGGRPLRRVQVSATSPELTESRSVSTNTQGVFEIKELPAGRYTVSASRAGFLRIQYGQRRPGEPGQPLQIADGQATDRIDFALPRMSVISGRITDEIGEPLAGVTVFPMQARYFRGRRRMVPVAGQARTDDTGEYRLIGLEPGDYYVMGTTRDTWTMEDDAKQRVGFGPTYFSGTLVMSNAQLVKLKLGQETSGVDFSMVPGRVAAITGTATTSSGAPLAGESVQMSQEFAGPTYTSMFGFGGGKISADGTFTIKDVPPGDYKLSVRYPGDKDHPAEGASTVVSVMGADIEGLSLSTGAAGSIAGRVITDDGTTPALGSVGAGRNDIRMRVSTRPIDPDTTYQQFNQDNGRVRDDGTFEVADVFGANRIQVGPLTGGWAVKSINVEGKDYADLPIEVRNGQRIEGMTIVISNKLPTLHGRLVDRDAQPAAGTIVLFPDDPAKWGEGSRLVKTTRPDATGAFEIRTLPAGDYLIAGIDYVQPGAADDPDFLKGLQDSGAQKITVTEMSAPSVTLTLKK